jgi:hypothetical protein
VEAQVAQRLADNIRLELERYGYHNVTTGLNAAADRLFLVATQDGTRVLITGEDPYEAWNDTYGNSDPDSATNYRDVASPLAAEKKLETDGSPDNPAGIAFRDRFFLIEVAWPSYPQFNNKNLGAVPLNIRVLWPYRLPNGPANPTSSSAYNDKDNLPWRVVAPADHSTMLFNVVLTP